MKARHRMGAKSPTIPPKTIRPKYTTILFSVLMSTVILLQNRRAIMVTTCPKEVSVVRNLGSTPSLEVVGVEGVLLNLSRLDCFLLTMVYRPGSQLIDVYIKHVVSCHLFNESA